MRDFLVLWINLLLFTFALISILLGLTWIIRNVNPLIGGGAILFVFTGVCAWLWSREE